MKALRFHLIGLPGRVVSYARQLIVRLGGGAEALATILDARGGYARSRMDRPDDAKPLAPHPKPRVRGRRLERS